MKRRKKQKEVDLKYYIEAPHPFDGCHHFINTKYAASKYEKI